jgi:Xaa-Pro aminopeptidase
MQEIFRKRRRAFLDGMARDRGDAAVAVLPAAPTPLRNGDVEHEWRQDSDLFYLTGFAEPDSVLVMSTRDDTTTLFVRPRDREREVWDGPRAGVEGARSEYGADAAFNVAELNQELARLLSNHHRLYYRLGRNRTFDDRLLALLDRSRGRGRTPTFYPAEIVDPSVVLHELRLRKDDNDLAAMRQAAAITCEAHLRSMAAARPGMHEYEIEAILLETFRRRGAARVAYGSIVGSGPNATVLHYRSNNRRMNAGDLLLVDAGCEYEYVASDVTRTFPVCGAFSPEQRAVYELVLDAQLACIDKTRVGQTIDEIHQVAVEAITRGLIRLGLLAGEVDARIHDESYRAFYMHRTSHWLGLDVHDVGAYYVGGKARRLEAGMVLTVEPGVYIPETCVTVDAKWRGIGVRIEDDVLVTHDAPDVLTAAIPKTIEEVERACAR